MADSSVAITAGSGTNIDTFTLPGGDHRQVVLSTTHKGGFRGRTCTFRTPGRAGTTGQKIFSIHNATGSTIAVEVKKITVDVSQTVVKDVTVIPPIIRLWKVTVLPTNGTALTKVAEDSSLAASDAAVTIRGDASADGTGSGTTLTATLPAGTFITQEFAARYIKSAGTLSTSPQAVPELMDRAEFLAGEDESVILNALEGLVVFLDYTVATANPTTDMWIVGCRWEEYTP
jgi:hypothetical protein